MPNNLHVQVHPLRQPRLVFPVQHPRRERLQDELQPHGARIQLKWRRRATATRPRATDGSGHALNCVRHACMLTRVVCRDVCHVAGVPGRVCVHCAPWAPTRAAIPPARHALRRAPHPFRGYCTPDLYPCSDYWHPDSQFVFAPLIRTLVRTISTLILVNTPDSYPCSDY